MSAIAELESVLRQLVVLRTNGSSPAAIEATTEAARELWAEVPKSGPPPRWSADVLAIASDLGFRRQRSVPTSELEPIDDSLVEAVDGDGGADDELDTLASRIDQAITEAGGIGNVKVACSPQRVVLTGIAADEEARDQALIVAAKLAPGMEIEDAIDVA